MTIYIIQYIIYKNKQYVKMYKKGECYDLSVKSGFNGTACTGNDQPAGQLWISDQSADQKCIEPKGFYLVSGFAQAGGKLLC